MYQQELANKDQIIQAHLNSQLTQPKFDELMLQTQQL